MNKLIKELANIIQDEIENKNVTTQISLTSNQIQEINEFARGLSRSSPFFPYPLKNR